MIHTYENRNKELSMEMHKLEGNIEKKTEEVPQREKTIPKESKVESKVESVSLPEPPKVEIMRSVPVESPTLREIFDKLCVFNLKSICLLGEGDPTLEELWRNMRAQIVGEERLRVLKCFISPENLAEVLGYINVNRIKKVDQTQLTTHTEEYDPFLVEQLKKHLTESEVDQTTINRWVASQFGPLLEHNEKLWMKHFSQEKLNCEIRTMAMERELEGGRKPEGEKELTLRDFTRHVSTLFKANLRNRNLYQLHSKLRGITYIGRLVELLQGKTSKGEAKKSQGSK